MDVFFFSEKWQLWWQPRPQGSLRNKLGSSRLVIKRGDYLFNGKILILLIIVNLASAEGQRRSPGWVACGTEYSFRQIRKGT